MLDMTTQTVIDPSARIGKNVKLRDGVIVKANVIIEDNAIISDNAFIDYGAIIRCSTIIGKGSSIGANAIVGQAPSRARTSTLSADSDLPCLKVGENCQICAGAIVYAGTALGSGCFIADSAQVREHCELGENVIVGHSATIENNCTIGDRTKIQTGAYIVAGSVLEEDVFIAPMVTTTNDNFIGRTEERFKYRKGVTVKKGGRIAGGAVILPGVTIGQEALVAAGSVVTKDVPPFKLVMGVPAKVVRDVPPEQIIYRD